MAVRAYIFIETDVGKSKEVAANIRQLDKVKSVDLVTGPYDIIAIVEAENLHDVGDLITGNIHPITGISRTVTCLAV